MRDKNCKGAERPLICGTKKAVKKRDCGKAANMRDKTYKDFRAQKAANVRDTPYMPLK